jgi:3-oxoadipate enol-lactonase
VAGDGFLETKGARIRYEESGAGEAVVLVHAGVANLRMWDGEVAALSDSSLGDSYRVIRYDTRGFGDTETEAVEFSNRADIAALLDHLSEPAAHVVGLSRGGMIALDFALEYPDRVRSLVVAAGGIGGYQPTEGLPPETWDAPEQMWEAKDWDALAEWEADFWGSGPGQPADRVPHVRARVHEWVLENYRAEKEEGKPQVLDPPAVERLHELRAPLLVLLGTLDEPGTTEAMRHLAATVPGARLEELESAHMLNLEHPERFAALLREHFERA